MKNIPTAEITIDDIHVAEYNPRIMPQDEMSKLERSISTFGLVDPIIVDLKHNNTIIGGHQRYEALKTLGTTTLTLIPLGDIGLVITNDKLKIKDENDQKALNITLNKITGEWDYKKLEDNLIELVEDNYQIELTGFTETELLELDVNSINLDTPEKKENDDAPTGRLMTMKYGTDSGTLARDFIVPPFSILSTRKDTWLQRKNYWDNLIQDNGESRVNKLGDRMGVSIFDSALAEVLLTWFLPTEQHCNVCDPFSGDSIIGYISTALDNTFTGTELRKEQADLNNERIAPLKSASHYYCDDGRNLNKYIHEKSQDLLISCPPYYNLEVYSDLENDASNQKTYEDFYDILDTAFSKTIPCLKNNRFAVIVVGDIRDKKGFYYDFPGDIINTFKNNGMGLYNRIVLENKVGSATLRARRYFKNRKVVKIHQNILVFFKGNPSNIKKDFGEITVLSD